MQILLFICCTSKDQKVSVSNPKSDKSKVIYNHITQDSFYINKFSKEFNVIEIMSKSIQEGSIVNARIEFKKTRGSKIFDDTTVWINDIIFSNDNEIIKWGKPGLLNNLFISPDGKKEYHAPISLN